MADSSSDARSSSQPSSGARSGQPSGNSYLVAARKYRPALFREVVAQQHVTDTLKNALKLDRLAHAYLFSGPRGVGKTTTARILAKAINCETPREEREDEAEPCRECDSCRAFEDGRSLNVFEMDAASNNKVDDIRELRETVRIPPQGSTKKVYILDEVHMLSTQAFNALLKTLEEPPPHALFIFATTEPHKVLPTILSRCQRFDFRRIPVPKIVAHLRRICESEGIEADEESLMLLARKGDGALRDALSAFDQAISLCGTTLEYSDLTQALGVVDQDLFFKLTNHVAEQDTAGVLQLVHHVVRSGYDLQEFLTGLAEHLRNLLVARSLSGSALEEVAAATQKRYAEEAQRFGEADLLRLLTIAGDAEDAVKNSSQPRLKLEMTLLKMAQMRRAADLKAVLRKLDRLERMVEDGDLPEALPDAVTADASGAGSGGAGSGGAGSDGSGASAAGAGSVSASTTSEPAASYDPSPNDDAPDADSGSTDAPSANPSTSDAPSSSSPSTDAAAGDAQAADAAPNANGSDASTSNETASNEGVSREAGRSGDPVGEGSGSEASGSEASGSGEPVGEGPEDGGGLPEEPDDPAFTTPFDEDDDPDDVPAPPEADQVGGENREGDVDYNDLFSSPALDKNSKGSRSGSGGASGGDGSGGTPSGADAQGGAAADGSDAGTTGQGDGQATAEATMVAEPGEGGTATATRTAGSKVLDAVADQWSDLVQAVMTEKISLGALLGDADPQSFNGRTLVIAAPKALHRDQFRSHKRYLLDKVQALTDDVESLQFVVDTSSDTAEDESSSNGRTETLDPREKMEKLRDTYPALDRLFDQFGAELVW